ncbi:TonB family C-terminal domain-containing protein [Alteromonadaceae bacterium Bs31]|nr:TonB family C-terminal domain-containing protein [Alteromonadaceae bacterium Bs31]
MIELDLLHIFSNFWLYPTLGLSIVLMLVQRPSFQSAANFHIFLTAALFVVVLATLMIPILPTWQLSIAPKWLVEATQFPLYIAKSDSGLWILYGSAAVYLLGVSWILSYTLLGILEVKRLSREAHAPGQEFHERLQDIDSKLQSLFAPGKKVRVLVSGDIQSPFVWKAKRPVILLPKASVDWSDDRLERVLAHEYAHIERSDWLYKLLARVAVSLCWFIPVVWFVSLKIDWYAELACDDRVVQLLDCRGEYADDLMALATDVRHSVFALSYLRGSELYLRISMVLDPCRQKNKFSLWQRCLLIGLLVTVFLPLASSRLQASSVYENIFDLGVYPEPSSVPLLVVPKNSPLASNETRLRWLERQLQLENVEHKQKKTNDTSLEQQQKTRQLLAAELNKAYQSAIKDESAFRSTEALLVLHREIKNRELEGFGTADYKPEEAISTPNIAIKGYIPTQVVTPEYPRLALKRNITGRVVVQFDVDENGYVQKPRILSARPTSIFDQAVLKAIKEFRFTPLTMGDKPVITKNVTETFIFTIKGTADDKPQRGA